MYLLLLRAFPFHLLKNLVGDADQPGFLSLVRDKHINGML